MKTFDGSKLKFKRKFVKDNFDELLFENDGSFTIEDQIIEFDYDGKELVVYFDLSVTGFLNIIEGDHFPHQDVTIFTQDITITGYCIDSDEIELTNEISSTLEKEVKKYL